MRGPMATRAEWVRWVQAWKGSGQTAATFARENGLSVATLRHWSWQLGREPQKATAEFVEVALPEQAEGEKLEVLLRDGIVIRVASGFDVGTLRRLIEAIQER